MKGTEWDDKKTMLLIKEYEKRNVLWDKNHKHYRSIKLREKHMNELATIVNVNRNELRKKVKSLLDIFREGAKRFQGLEEKEKISRSKWFAKLQFLSGRPKAETFKKKWSDENTMLLIQEYKKRTLLWDKNHEHFRNEKLREQHFNELANCLNENIVEVKKKIVRLLDVFSAETKRIQRLTEQGDTAGVEKICEWKWFTSLQFLTERFEKKKPKPTLDWSDDKTMLLIEEYQKRSLLWDTNHEYYKNPELRKEQLSELAKIFNVSLMEVRKKIRKILNIHRDGTRIVQDLKEKGLIADVNKFVSKWFERLQFLSGRLALEKSKSIVEWDNDKTMRLIQEYKKNRLLWDKNHEHYRNNKLREEHIIELANIIGVNVSDIKKQINRLLTLFHKKSMRIKKLKEKGDIKGVEKVNRSTWFSKLQFLSERPNQDKYDMLLINEYKKRRMLWDENHIYYSIRKHRENEWKELAKAINMDRVKAQKRMHKILKPFRDAWQKAQELEKKGDKEGVQEIWKRKWFSSLTFLMDKKQRKSADIGNIEMDERTETADISINSKMEVDETVQIKDKNKTEYCSTSGVFQTCQGSMSQSDVSQITDFQNAVDNDDHIFSWDQRDECEDFGHHVVDRLRNLTKVDRALVIYKINNLIYEAYIEGPNKTFNNPALGKNDYSSP